MTAAVATKIFAHVAPAPKCESPPWVTPLLTRIRLSALHCRVAARTDLFEACAVLSMDRETARTAHIEVLTRCLIQALGRRPVFYRPGVSEISFDEAWLMRLVETAANDDLASFTFLIRSRVLKPARRNLSLLVDQIARIHANY